MAELERLLTAAAREVDWPETPVIALPAGAPRGRRRRLVLAVAVSRARSLRGRDGRSGGPERDPARPPPGGCVDRPRRRAAAGGGTAARGRARHPDHAGAG